MRDDVDPGDWPRAVEFYFDPMCPYAYQSSRWIRAVRDRVPLDIAWRFFSLEEINREDGKKHPWERPWSYGWGQMRVGALVRRRGGQGAVDRWYAAVGHAFHRDGRRTHDRAVHREVLAEAGFDPGLLDEAIDDPSTDDEVLADHRTAVRDLGAFGVATMRFDDGTVVFGPNVVPAPSGDDALELFDLVLRFGRFPHLYELRHPKTAADLAHVASAFEPYLAARSWRTVERPAP